jgi:EAL domain-containing protein (putative c-di-GMP-specific phosphodiesterase class I)
VTHKKAETIRSTIEDYIFEFAGQSLIATASIGICSVRKSDTSAEEVLSRADLACEAVRLSGGNGVLVSSALADEMLTGNSNEGHKEVVSRILIENRIEIYYQPISALSTVTGSHFEVLTRIVDEDGNMILPGEFFAMAASSGQTVDIDRYIIENIMKMMAEYPHQDMTLFIKLTGQSVADHELPIWIIRKIKEYKINPEQLVFEVAENTLQSDIKNVSALSRALNSIGCKIAIEHYRMSTQAQHLKHIHADYLKIDRGLVESIGRKGGSLAKVTAIMAMAREHNYMTIAEGVESPASLAILWELGVHYAQGYFIHAPSEKRDYEFHEERPDEDLEDCNRATFTVE